MAGRRFFATDRFFNQTLRPVARVVSFRTLLGIETDESKVFKAWLKTRRDFYIPHSLLPEQLDGCIIHASPTQYNVIDKIHADLNANPVQRPALALVVNPTVNRPLIQHSASLLICNYKQVEDLPQALETFKQMLDVEKRKLDAEKEMHKFYRSECHKYN